MKLKDVWPYTTEELYQRISQALEAQGAVLEVGRLAVGAINTRLVFPLVRFDWIEFWNVFQESRKSCGTFGSHFATRLLWSATLYRRPFW